LAYNKLWSSPFPQPFDGKLVMRQWEYANDYHNEDRSLEMTSNSIQIPGLLGSNPLCIAVISPSVDRRNAAIAALDRFPDGWIREYIAYPPDKEAVAQMLKYDFDVVIIDLDSDTEYALELIEEICADSLTQVISFSSDTDQDLLLRCMRAGAREFLPMPLTSDAMARALTRVSARRIEKPARTVAKPSITQSARGKMLIFLSAKGGAGVTTLSCALALSLAQEFQKRTLLIDLNFPLGDAALTLGLVSEYTTKHALENSNRLDATFLASLLVQHDSGLFVLAAPSELAPTKTDKDNISKLLRVAHNEFDFVVVDAGSRLDFQDGYSFDESTTYYMVTQIGLPELRNANRLIKQLAAETGNKLEIVINRHDANSEGIGEAHVNMALTRNPSWKIPNDYAAVRQMQNSATSLTHDNSPIGLAVRQLAESVCGQPPVIKKKRGLRFF
jgi:pilus assembly protein CpaE